jgi:hypothetical protein
LEKKQRSIVAQNQNGAKVVSSNSKAETERDKNLNNLKTFKIQLQNGNKNELPHFSSSSSSEELNNDTKSNKKSKKSDDEVQTDKKETEMVESNEVKNNENNNSKSKANSQNNEDDLRLKDRSLLSRKAKAVTNSSSCLRKNNLDEAKNTHRIIKDMDNLV